MYSEIFLWFSILVLCSRAFGQEVYETDMNFRVDPGSRTCFFENGQAGQMMEAKYEVIDGQHGDYDITFTVADPTGNLIVNDYKSSHNSIIMDLEVSGDYVFCLDNEHSVMNSKLVFVYVVIEDKPAGDKHVGIGSAVNSMEGAVTDDKHNKSHTEQEVLNWIGTDENGETYYIPVADIADLMTRTLRHVVKARQALNIYGALKSRDSYLAFEDTFIVDMWSAFQISFMCLVGFVQVYMIKKLFSRPVTKGGYY